LHNDLGVALFEKARRLRAQIAQATPRPDSQPIPGQGESLKLIAQANEQFAEALRLDERFPAALFNQALCYQQLKLINQASEAWRKYLALNPQGPWAEEAKRYLKRLEEEKQKTAQLREMIYQGFLAARQSNDETRAWEAIGASHERSGNQITERLLDEYLAYAAQNQRAEATRRLDWLDYLTRLEERRAGELFTRDLAGFYRNLNDRQRISVSDARSLVKQARQVSPTSKTQAFALYQRARAKFIEAGNQPEAKLVLLLLCHIHVRQSEVEAARALVAELQAFAERYHYLSLKTQAYSLLADLEYNEGNYAQAIWAGKRAFARAVQLNNGYLIDLCSSFFITTYFTLGDYNNSLDWLAASFPDNRREKNGWQQLLSAFGEASDNFAGLCLFHTAAACLKEALFLSSKTPAPLLESRSLTFLSGIYAQLRDYTNAIDVLNRAKDIGQSLEKSPTSMDIGSQAILHLGHVYRMRGDWARAAEQYQEFLRLNDPTLQSYRAFYARRGLFLTRLAQNNVSAAESELREALGLFETHRAQIAEEGLRNTFSSAEQDIYDLAIQFAADQQANAELAFNYAESSRARNLFERLKTNQAESAASRFDSSIRSLPLSAIQRQIPSDVQIIQYSVSRSALHIWVVSDNTFQHTRGEVGAAELSALTQSYLRYLTQAGDDQAEHTSELAKRLYRALIAPVVAALDERKQICIVPDDCLNALPFSALIEPGSGKYMVEKYEITVAPSSAIFLACTYAARAKETSGTENCLAIGDPSFDQTLFPSLMELSGAAREAQRIAEQYPRARVLTDQQATESALRGGLSEASVLHLATHGLNNEQRPDYSSIVLAKGTGVQQTENDGLLEAREIAGLSFPKTKLVVLSACQTWVGKNYRGEGMVGLARSFLAAGVPLVIASLWMVNSETTVELMENFHRLRKRADLSTAQALRRAQLDMLHHPETRMRRPYYWAAFIVAGGHANY
jgi:CHAT domain-containing protein